MRELPDIRRTINIFRKITGAEVAEALKEFAEQSGEEYSEKLLYDIDGKKTVMIGIQSQYPYKCIMVRTGENLANHEIKLEDSYDTIGIGSSNEFMPDMVYAIGYGNESIVKAVETARDGLEKIL